VLVPPGRGGVAVLQVVLHVVGLPDDMGVPDQEAKPDDVAITADQRGENAEGISPEPVQHPGHLVSVGPDHLSAPGVQATVTPAPRLARPVTGRGAAVVSR
jgi:hypothetical protein